MRFILLLVVFSGLLGCDMDPDRCFKVQYIADGIFDVSYEWEHVEEVFGKDRKIAVPAYLEAENLIPADCTRGVTVVRGGKTQSGWGWAEFRCK